MIEQNIRLNSIEEVKAFVNITTNKDYDIELLCEKYIVNAKSIMGIFSLDLTKPIKMVAHCSEQDSILQEIAEFAC